MKLTHLFTCECCEGMYWTVRLAKGICPWCYEKFLMVENWYG